MKLGSGGICSRGAAMVCLGLCILLQGILWASAQSDPFDHDITYYATLGHEISSGRPLYTWVMDHKPLGIHLTFALFDKLFGPGIWTLWIMGVVGATATLLTVYLVATTLSGRAAGVVAAVAWSTISCVKEFGGHNPNTEVFMNPFLMAALYVFVRWQTKFRPSYPLAALAGLLLFAASFYKHVVVGIAGCLLIAHILDAWRDNDRNRLRVALIEAFAAGALSISGWLVYVLYFAGTGRWSQLYDMQVVFNRDYAGSLKVNLVDGLRADRLFPALWTPVMPILAFVAGTFILYPPRLRFRHRLLLTAFGCGTFVAVALPGKWYGHYYQLWLPYLCVLFGVAAICWSRLRTGGFSAIWLIPSGLTIALVLWWQKPTLQRSANNRDFTEFAIREDQARGLVVRIRDLFVRPVRLFHWGTDTGLYFYSGFRPATGWVSNYGVTSGSLSRKLQEKIVGEVSVEQPELVILSKSDAPNGFNGNPVLDGLARSYVPFHPVPETALYYIFVRSDLESSFKHVAPLRGL